MLEGEERKDGGKWQGAKKEGRMETKIELARMGRGSEWERRRVKEERGEEKRGDRMR